MSLHKYIERISYIDILIRNKATGSATELAKKLALSERATLEHIKLMKNGGCPIKFSRKNNSYYYTENEVTVMPV